MLLIGQFVIDFLNFKLINFYFEIKILLEAFHQSNHIMGANFSRSLKAEEVAECRKGTNCIFHSFLIQIVSQDEIRRLYERFSKLGFLFLFL
jgi:hypothetical protein